MFPDRMVPFELGLPHEDIYAGDDVRHVITESSWLAVGRVNGKRWREATRVLLASDLEPNSLVLTATVRRWVWWFVLSSRWCCR